MRPRLGVLLSNLVPSVVPTMPALVDLAVELERGGADAFAFGEHVAWFNGMVHHGGDELPRSLMASMPDTMVAFAAIAARTTRVRLLSALVAPARHPLVVARSAGTLHLLSDGRFDLGLAAGWSTAELAALGVPYEQRFSRLEETVRACRALWDGPGATTFHGEHHAFEGVLPLPFPDGRVPIWLGAAASPQMARRVATWCDGWMTSTTATPDEVARGIELLAPACAALGRDPASIGVSVQVRGSTLDEVWDQVVEAIGLGATQVVVPIGRIVTSRAGATGAVAELARRLDLLASASAPAAVDRQVDARDPAGEV